VKQFNYQFKNEGDVENAENNNNESYLLFHRVCFIRRFDSLLIDSKIEIKQRYFKQKKLNYGRNRVMERRYHQVQNLYGGAYCQGGEWSNFLFDQTWS
jgi:hypothetical protein